MHSAHRFRMTSASSLAATLVLGMVSACSQAQQVAAPLGAAPGAADRQTSLPERPPFMGEFGGLLAGQPMPGARVHSADGKAVDLREQVRGRTLLFLWSKGPEGANLAFIERLAREYADQGVRVLGVATFCTREDFQRWLAANKGHYSFPVLFDPAGPLPPEPADMSKVTQEQLRQLQTEGMAILRASIVGQLQYVGEPLRSGQYYAVPGMPVIVAFDDNGKLVGVTSVGAPPRPKAEPVPMAEDAQGREGLGNLLLLTGVKPRPQDAPKRVFTAEMVAQYNQWAAAERARQMAAQRPPLPIGAMAPDFTMVDVNGKPVKLSDFHGKVVLLDYWATWCGPCVASMPHMQELAEKYRDQGVVVLGSATDDARAAFEGWVGKNQRRFPGIVYAHDPAERAPNRASNALYGVRGLPTQFVIDRNGKIVGRTLGAPREGASSPTALLEYYLSQAGVKVPEETVKQGEENAANVEELFRKLGGNAVQMRTAPEAGAPPAEGQSAPPPGAVQRVPRQGGGGQSDQCAELTPDKNTASNPTQQKKAPTKNGSR